ncbi:hypothetical protein BN1723_016535, partial [Verticillium longisporum]
DRITVYGNTGTTLQGDDYYVTEISLLYTEFKKMEGHIVQAPNSVLNTLFILNQRRSAGLADPVELRLGFGTDPQLIEDLKARMTDYCLANKRDYKPSVLTEVRTLNDVQSFTMNFIFFHKSNFQNELTTTAAEVFKAGPLRRPDSGLGKRLHRKTAIGLVSKATSATMSSPVNQKHDEYDEKHSNHTAETLHDPANLQSHTDSQKPSQERPLMPLHVDSQNHLAPPTEGPFSPNGGGTREQASRLTDDLELLRVERLISNQENELNRSRSRSRQHQPEPEDLFAGKAVEDEEVERPPPEKKAGIFGYWLLRWLKKLPRCFRYIFYLLPGATLLLIPILIGYFSPGDRPVGGDGGVELMWFGIWLMIVWCTIWGARMITSLMPPTFAGIATLMGSNNGKKWKDIGRVLELHTALFIWMLSVLVSFKPINNSHRVPRTGDGDGSVEWINTVYKVIIAIFVLSALNFVEKIIIQWIATSFHQRTYAKRIEDNRSDIHHLIHLYDYAKEKIAHDDAIWETTGEAREGSGSRTPMAQLHNNVRQVFNKAGGLANRPSPAARLAPEQYPALLRRRLCSTRPPSRRAHPPPLVKPIRLLLALFH